MPRFDHESRLFRPQFESLEARFVLFGTGLLGELIHEQITAEALWFLKPEVLQDIQDEHTTQDLLGQFDAEKHFDNCRFSDAVNEIRRNYHEALATSGPATFATGGSLRSGGEVTDYFGRLLHSVQDFYAHSNWVDLGLSHLVDESPGPWQTWTPYSIHSGVVVLEGTSNSPMTILGPATIERRFQDADGNGQLDTFSVDVRTANGVLQGLITGSSASLFPNTSCPASAVIRHGYYPLQLGAPGMSKDEPRDDDTVKSRQFEQAKSLAIRQTRHEFYRLVKLIAAEHGEPVAERFINAWVRSTQDARNALEAIFIRNGDAPPGTWTPDLGKYWREILFTWNQGNSAIAGNTWPGRMFGWDVASGGDSAQGESPVDALSRYPANATSGLADLIAMQSMGADLPLLSQSLGESVGLGNILARPFNQLVIDASATMKSARDQLSRYFTVEYCDTAPEPGSNDLVRLTWRPRISTWERPTLQIGGKSGFSYFDDGVTGSLSGYLQASAPQIDFEVTFGVDLVDGKPAYYVADGRRSKLQLQGIRASGTVLGELDLRALANVRVAGGASVELDASVAFVDPGPANDGKIRLEDFERPIASAVTGRIDGSLRLSNVNLSATTPLLPNIRWSGNWHASINNNVVNIEAPSLNLPDAGSLLSNLAASFIDFKSHYPLFGSLATVISNPLPVIGQSMADLLDIDQFTGWLTKTASTSLQGFESLKSSLERELSGEGYSFRVLFTVADIPRLVSGESVDLVRFDASGTATLMEEEIFRQPVFSFGIPDLLSVNIEAFAGVGVGFDYFVGMGIDTRGIWIAPRTGIGLGASRSSPHLCQEGEIGPVIYGGVEGNAQVLGFDLARAGGSLGVGLTAEIRLEDPTAGDGKVHLSDLDVGAGWTSGVLNALRMSVAGDFNMRVFAEVDLLLATLRKEWCRNWRLFKIEKKPVFPGSFTNDSTTADPPSPPAQVRDGVLRIFGTGEPDVLRLAMEGERVSIQWRGYKNATYANVKSVVFLGDGGNDRLLVAEPFNLPITADGGAGQDTLEGGGLDDSLGGGTGNDLLVGRGGSDILQGADDDDELWGGDGEDQLIGGGGSNRIHGGAGSDTMTGGSDADQIYGDEGDDSLFGRGGDDVLVGGPGRDYADGGDGSDFIDGGVDADSLRGGFGPDGIVGGSGDDWIFGDDDNDNLWGDAGQDRLEGGGGSDLISGGPDDDSLLGGLGADGLEGDEGDDSLDGNDDNDNLNGGAGNDSLMGGAGNDLLDGGIGKDILSGGPDDDQLTVGFQLDAAVPQDEIAGGAGRDTMRIAGTVHDDYIQLVQIQTETLVATLRRMPGDASKRQMAVTLPADVETLAIDGGAGDDHLLVDPLIARGVVLVGGPGADILVGGAGPDRLIGDSSTESSLFGVPLAGWRDEYTSSATAANHEDKLFGGRGNDILEGGDGNDTLRGGDGDDILYGHSGADRLDGELGRDVSYGGDGNDVLLSGEGMLGDLLYGGGDDDTLVGGEGVDFLDGSFGDDTLFGGDSLDVLRGGPDSTPVGETDRDLLIGETGRDFIFGGGDVDQLWASSNPQVRLLAGLESVELPVNMEELIGYYLVTVFDDPRAEALQRLIDRRGQVGFSAEQERELTLLLQYHQLYIRETELKRIVELLRLRQLAGEPLTSDERTTLENASAALAAINLAQIDKLADQRLLVDMLVGGDGDDLLYGSEFDDYIDGAAGDDAIFNGPGRDQVVGGPGSKDRFVVLGDESADLIRILVASDGLSVVMEVNGKSFNVPMTEIEIASVDSAGGNDVVVVESGAKATMTIEIKGGEGDDWLDASNLEADALLSGGAGDDNLIAGRGANDVQGGPDDDVLFAKSGTGVLSGGDGDDTFHFEIDATADAAGRVRTQLDGGSGTDRLLVRGTDGPDVILLGASDIERFDTAPAWLAAGNTSGNNDFGFSQTGPLAGAAGGRFARTGTFDYYAQSFGERTLNLSNSLTASGELLVNGQNNWNAGIGVAYFSRSRPGKDSLGWWISEPNDAYGARFQAFFRGPNGQINASNPLRVPRYLGETLAWQFSYDPAGGSGNGVVRVSFSTRSSGLFLGAVELFLTQSERESLATFDAFGVVKDASSAPDPTRWVEAYFDNLRYTRSAAASQGVFVNQRPLVANGIEAIEVLGGDGDDAIESIGGSGFIDGGAGDDAIVIQGGDYSVDGGAGTNRLMVRGDERSEVATLSGDTNAMEITSQGASLPRDFASNPNWSSSNSTSNGNNFGYKTTNSFTQSTGGEIGGRFARSAPFAYYADTSLAGPLGLDSALTASGQFVLSAVGTFNHGVGAAFFSQATSGRARLGWLMAEPASGTSGARLVAFVGTSDGLWVQSAPLVVDPYLRHRLTWQMDYIPDGGTGYGQLNTAFWSESSGAYLGAIQVSLDSQHRRSTTQYDAFGVFTGGLSSLGADVWVDAYFDNMSYSGRKMSNTEGPSAGAATRALLNLVARDIHLVSVDMAGGRDWVDASRSTFPIVLDGGSGADVLRGGSSADWMLVSDGPDYVDGGPGSDDRLAYIPALGEAVVVFEKAFWTNASGSDVVAVPVDRVGYVFQGRFRDIRQTSRIEAYQVAKQPAPTIARRGSDSDLRTKPWITSTAPRYCHRTPGVRYVVDPCGGSWIQEGTYLGQVDTSHWGSEWDYSKVQQYGIYSQALVVDKNIGDIVRSGDLDSPRVDEIWRRGFQVLGPIEATQPEGVPADYLNWAAARGKPLVARDNVDGDVAFSFSPANGSILPLGSTEIKAIATDKAGNRREVRFVVVVRDSTPPQIGDFSGEMLVESNHPDGAVVFFDPPIVQDRVDPRARLTMSHASGSLFPWGTTRVVASAVDASGNLTQKYRLIRVIDSSAPNVVAVRFSLAKPVSESTDWRTFPNRNSPASQITTVEYRPVGGNGGIALAGQMIDAVHGASQSHVYQSEYRPRERGVPESISVGYLARVASATPSTNARLSFGIVVQQDGDSFALETPAAGCVAIAALGLADGWVRLGATFGAGSRFVHIAGPGKLIRPDLANLDAPLSFGFFTTLQAVSTATSVKWEVADLRIDAAVPIERLTPIFIEAIDASGAPVPQFDLVTNDPQGVVNATRRPVSTSAANWAPLGSSLAEAKTTDRWGNTKAIPIPLMVRDTTAPVFTEIQPDIFVEATLPEGAIVDFAKPTAVDAVDDFPTVTTSPPSGSSFPIGTTTVRQVARDRFGNMSASEFKVIVGASILFAMDDSKVMEEDSQLEIDIAGVLANDRYQPAFNSGSGKLRLHLGRPPENGALVTTKNDSFIYIPSPDFQGVDRFTYRFEAASGLVSNEATVQIDVVSVNDRPVATSDTFRIVRGQSLEVAGVGVLGNDSDRETSSESLTAVLIAPTRRGNLILDPSGRFSYQPSSGFAGVDTFTYLVRDGGGESSAVASVDIVVEPRSQWQNVNRPADVNRDLAITPLDALLIINELNSKGARKLPDVFPGGPATAMIDVSGDGSLTPLDALLVINHLNSTGSGEGELPDRIFEAYDTRITSVSAILAPDCAKSGATGPAGRNPIAAWTASAERKTLETVTAVLVKRRRFDWNISGSDIRERT